MSAMSRLWWLEILIGIIAAALMLLVGRVLS